MRLILVILTGFSLACVLVGTVTNKWYRSPSNEFSQGLWEYCQQILSTTGSSATITLKCRKQEYFACQGLAVTALFFLSTSLALLIRNYYRAHDRILAYITLLILLLSTVLLGLSYLLYPRDPKLEQVGFSMYLMLIGNLFLLLSTGFFTYLTHSIHFSSKTANKS